MTWVCVCVFLQALRQILSGFWERPSTGPGLFEAVFNLVNLFNLFS